MTGSYTFVAEGIETPEQLNVLREKKCDFGKGIFSAAYTG
jgi:EAL domain-containing protein (putative c-di-GMP-specific phosphodiesterase class I)